MIQHLNQYLKDQGYTIVLHGPDCIILQTTPRTSYNTQLRLDGSTLHIGHYRSNAATINLADPDSLEQLTQVLDRMECTKQ